jgi:hypothetical protein
MVRAHKQAWVWQDEWWGLTIEDIRQIERETQEALAAKMAQANAADDEEPSDELPASLPASASTTPTSKDAPVTVTVDENKDCAEADGREHKTRVSFSESRQKLFPRPPDRRPSRGLQNSLSNP